MKVNELKAALEKVSRVIPELRKDLDDAYHMESGKKKRFKEIWKQYESKYKEVMNSKVGKTLQ